MSVFENIDIAILAGGLGTRLRNVVTDRPKVLADINGRPFISFLLDQLCLAGASRVILCTGYMAEKVRATVGARYRTIDVFYSEEKKPLGTGGALRYATESFIHDWILVINGDSFIEDSLPRYLSWHRGKNAQASVIVTPVADVSRYGAVQLSDDEKIVAFREKADNSIGPGYINAGVYLMHKSIVTALKFEKRCSLETEVLPALVNSELYGYESSGRFIDIGTGESYRDAGLFFR